MKLRRIHVLLAILVVTCALIPFAHKFRSAAMGLLQKTRRQYTVEDRLSQFGEQVRARLAPEFAAIGVNYPPRKMVLIGLKDENILEVWVSDKRPEFRHLKVYPILAASGELGPKLAEGDRQVPEGLYRVESLHPNSAYHLALRLNYPNEFDRKMATLDGRRNLGSDIMIHGRAASIGCLAMGDTAAEDLFILTALAGVENTRVILSPVDFRTRQFPGPLPPPKWTVALYNEVKAELADFRK